MEKWMYCLAGIYIAWMAVVDLIRKEIPVLPGLICGGVILLTQLLSGNNWLFRLSGMVIGIALLLLNRITKGKIGAGDALVYTVTGAALGFTRNLELLMLSLLFASLAAIALIVIRHVGRNYAMPFIPFTAVAYGMVVLL
jgi:prepilin signal peptidase PulO-like enzyme (type II secretory pathway)